MRKTLLLIALLAATGMVRAANPEAPVINKSEMVTPGKPADLQKLMKEFSARRDAILADREAFMNQLKTATVEQRKEILAKMQAQQKELVEAQRAIGRQIRDEMRKLKLASPAGR
ncbi:hypothetical protein [Opitutus sp. ER46]|uniref:hypothetical protein n=1 Tax=Opitutus sp. ER46 TaxID=2161864 RepID=UPI0011B22E07|nr:hypothetical protein [Opitutus sp. ER46]